MNRSLTRAARRVFPAIVALVLAGCSPGSRPVVRVAERTATVDDFLRAASASNPMESGAGPVPMGVLDGLVRDQLLLVAAHRHGDDTTAAYRQFRATTSEQLMLRRLAAELAPPDAGVSEAEAKELWKWRQTQADVQLIYTSERTIIDLANRAIAGGMPFETAADQFNAPGTVPPGGSLGLVSAGQLGPPLDDAIRTLPVGQVGGPIGSPQGWFLVKVRRRVPAPTVAFELERSSLMENLRQLKQRQAMAGALFALERENQLAIDPEADQQVFLLLAPARVGNAPPPNPTPAERRRVLVRWNGGTYTLADAIADLGRSDVRPPNASVTPAIRAWIESRAITRIALAEGHRRHLDEEPDFVHALNDQLDRYLLQVESSNAVVGTVAPGDSAAEAMWNSVKAQYPQVLSAHVRWVATPDTALASAVARDAAAAGGLAAAARAAGRNLVVHEQALSFPVQDPAWSGVVSGFARLSPGGVRGPDFAGGQWRVIQLVDKREGPVEWAQLTPEMKMSVRGSGMQSAREQRFAAYVDSLRRALNPVVLPQNLRGVAWPPAEPASAAP